MKIQVLSQKVINEIAAGEVIERPLSVVKEAVENSMDAGTNAITVEIKNGGIDFIRVTDNGAGILKEEIERAFTPHATSKLTEITDLLSLSTLGFRGEALPSIAAVSKTEMISKTKEELSGISYVIHGGKKISLEEIGAPDGVSLIVEDLFYNVPARRKFLKSASAEAALIGDLMEKYALLHPEIRFKFISNGQTKISTSGTGNLRDVLYSLYGKETEKEVVDLQYEKDGIRLFGVLGKPILAKGSRSFEITFVNGRYIQSKILSSALESGYEGFMMKHHFPFAILFIELPPDLIDVNVHPNKMDVRFQNETDVFENVRNAVSASLKKRELIPTWEPEEEEERNSEYSYTPEPFERAEETSSFQWKKEVTSPFQWKKEVTSPFQWEKEEASSFQWEKEEKMPEKEKEESFFQRIEQKNYRLIGSVFDTYWLVEMENSLYIMDQHAAHEKILYEQKRKELAEKTITSQTLLTPIILTVTEAENEFLKNSLDEFTKFGFDIRAFGEKEYAVFKVPNNLFGLPSKELLEELMAQLAEDYSPVLTPETVLDKIASMSCKAAVKGNEKISYIEAEHLLNQLLTLENPYACPHGRPTVIEFSKTDIEKKFKRIVQEN